MSSNDPVAQPSAARDLPPVNPLNPQGLSFHRFNLGDIEVFQLFEGATSREISPRVLRNGDVEQVEAALRRAGYAGDRIPNSYTITIARIGGRLVMFDSGRGEEGRPSAGLLGRSMRLAGLDPKNLSTIVITHFHPDHIYGLMTDDGGQVYPDLEIHVPAAEYAFWSDPGNLTRMPKSRVPLANRILATLPGWPNITRYAADKDVLPGIRAVPSYGHSAGHTSLLLSSGDARFMVLGDVTNIPFLNLHNPHWHLAIDDDPEMAEVTRRRMLDMVVADQIPCAGYHWGMPGAGRVVKDGSGFALDSFA